MITSFVISPPPQASLAVQGTGARFPVRRIFCVGRNYAEHVREMGNDEREPPFFFCKPADAVMDSGSTVPYPPDTQDLHNEVELVVAIGTGGRDIAPDAVRDHIWGAGVGIDLTRRDLQTVAKTMGRPWDFAKGFDHSAPIGALKPLDNAMTLDAGRIWLAVNGTVRQDADLADMIWPVAEHVSKLSFSMALEPGDLIMTGTPAGVAALEVGDVVTAEVAGIGTLSITIGPAKSDD